MPHRFQIQDLIAQDPAGVTYRAMDLSTHREVALRRSFPFGIAGRGLSAVEQTRYQQAAAQLFQINHRNLHKIFHSGYDEIDGIPFLATEWLDGQTLEEWLGGYPLSAIDAVGVIAPALKVCETLSKVLGHQAVWIETNLAAIIVAERGVCFWAAPGKLLESPSLTSPFDAIVTLTQQLMGWREEAIADQAGEGLGGWLNWLREAKQPPTFEQAAAKLAASVRLPAPPPQVPLKAKPPSETRIARSTKPRARKKRSVNWVPIAITALVLIAASLGSWVIFQQNPNEAARPSVASKPLVAFPSAPLVSVIQTAEILTPPLVVNEPVVILKPENPVKPTVLEQVPQAPQVAEVSETAEVVNAPRLFSPTDLALLNLNKQAVTMEGVLAKIDTSSSGKTLYLLFSEKPKATDGRGTITIKSSAVGLSIAELSPLLGHKIQLTGKLAVKKIFGTFRPELIIKNRAAIISQ